jgi:hypothetical protein
MELHKIFDFLLVRVDSRFPGLRIRLRGLRKWPLQEVPILLNVIFFFLWGSSKEEAYRSKLITRDEM